ncbi:MAG TPA: HD domain-containing protein [Bryobacteraceae bacterium]|nr:HD domain-containing protein [Bryobacteraceae bacterium]
MILTDRFDRALLLASELHRKQKRKTSGAPYLSHLLGVCSLVLEDGGGEDEAIAALLHDSVEDQSAGYAGGEGALRDHIGVNFGPEVLRLVDALTERRSPETAAIRDKRERWRTHKQAYIEQILSYDLPVRRISCADSLYNVRSLISGYRAMGEKLWTRFMTREAADQLWGYSAISRAFTQAGGIGLAAELEDAIDQLHRVTGRERTTP